MAKKFFSNRIKCVSAVTMVIFGITIGILGAVIYIMWSREINPYSLDGKDFLPLLKVDFSAFAPYVLVSAIGCVMVFAMSLITSYYKRPYLSFIYVLLSLIVAAMLFMTSFQCGDFKKTADEAYAKVCASESPVPPMIRKQLVGIVDTFMCTSDCKCYSGAGDATKALWQTYDETVIMDKFLRNTSDKNK